MTDNNNNNNNNKQISAALTTIIREVIVPTANKQRSQTLIDDKTGDIKGVSKSTNQPLSLRTTKLRIALAMIEDWFNRGIKRYNNQKIVQSGKKKPIKSPVQHKKHKCKFPFTPALPPWRLAMIINIMAYRINPDNPRSAYETTTLLTSNILHGAYYNPNTFKIADLADRETLTKILETCEGWHCPECGCHLVPDDDDKLGPDWCKVKDGINLDKYLELGTN